MLSGPEASCLRDTVLNTRLQIYSKIVARVMNWSCNLLLNSACVLNSWSTEAVITRVAIARFNKQRTTRFGLLAGWHIALAESMLREWCHKLSSQPLPSALWLASHPFPSGWGTGENAIYGYSSPYSSVLVELFSSFMPFSSLNFVMTLSFAFHSARLIY
jgi:hypothetical protein